MMTEPTIEIEDFGFVRKTVMKFEDGTVYINKNEGLFWSKLVDGDLIPCTRKEMKLCEEHHNRWLNSINTYQNPYRLVPIEVSEDDKS